MFLIIAAGIVGWCIYCGFAVVAMALHTPKTKCDMWSGADEDPKAGFPL